MLRVEDADIWYLACPYNHEDLRVRIARYDNVTLATAKLAERGVMCFSPITHSHPLTQYAELPRDWGFWFSFDQPIMRLCGKCIVLTLDGWDESVGVTDEIEWFEELSYPIKYINPVGDVMQFLRGPFELEDEPRETSNG